MRFNLQMQDDDDTGYGQPRDGEPPRRRVSVEGDIVTLGEALELVEAYLKACGFAWDSAYSLDLVDEWGCPAEDPTSPPPPRPVTSEEP